MVADLTGKNANVYYELAVAHAFARPVALLVDHATELSFDSGHEKVVEIEDDGIIAVRQATKARDELRRVLEVVMADDYEPTNLVIEVATARRLQDLAPDDPIAAELANIRGDLGELLSRTPPAGGMWTNRFYTYPYTLLPDPTAAGGVAMGNVSRPSSTGTLFVDTAAGRHATDIPLLTLRQEPEPSPKPDKPRRTRRRARPAPVGNQS